MTAPLRPMFSAVVVLSLLLASLVSSEAFAKKKKGSGGSPGSSRVRPAEVHLKAAEPAAQDSANASAANGAPTRGPTRIDFDDRLIQGQSNKSGAVYLYDRKELKTRSMIKKRDTFREEIISSVYDG